MLSIGERKRKEGTAFADLALYDEEEDVGFGAYDLPVALLSVEVRPAVGPMKQMKQHTDARRRRYAIQRAEVTLLLSYLLGSLMGILRSYSGPKKRYQNGELESVQGPKQLAAYTYRRLDGVEVPC